PVREASGKNDHSCPPCTELGGLGVFVEKLTSYTRKRRQSVTKKRMQREHPGQWRNDTYTSDTPEVRFKKRKLFGSKTSPSPKLLTIKIPRFEAACPLCGVNIWGTGTLSKHLASRHGNVKACYVCRKCNKLSSNCHSIACHVPKCTTPLVAQLTGPSCTLCGKRFTTKRGLSQHMRHAHPSEWNEKKIAELQTERPSGQAMAKWETMVIKRNESCLPEEKPDTQVPCTSPMLPTTPHDHTKERFLAKMLKPLTSKKNCISRSIIKMVLTSNGNDNMSDHNAELLIKALGRKTKTKTPDATTRSMVTEPVSSKPRRLYKTTRFRSCQILYDKDQGTLANMILDGKDNTKCSIPMATLHTTFLRRWQRKTEHKGLGPFKSIGGVLNDILYRPITPKEVINNLNKMKNGTAPGPDGITKKNINNWDVYGVALALEYTRWLIQGTIPAAVKDCKTSLLPKSTNPDDLKITSNWRPITIGSMLLRLFSRILTMRLVQACPLNPRQRGFMTEANGCAENLMILDKLIASSRSNKTTLAIVFIDFAKAFDSISHDHILHALKRRGLDHHIWGLIKNSYESCTTRISCGKIVSDTIQILMGVKQGDPMSPLLFNLSMDPLIQYLEDSTDGLELKGRRISTLAFADDLVLVSGSKRGMGNLLATLEKFCRLTGLSVQPKKCCGFIYEHGLLNAGGPWKLEGLPIQMIDPGEKVKYLGVHIRPDKGIVPPELKEDMARWLINIKKAYLKPSQKITILNTYAIPRIIYKASMGKTPITYLMEIDRMIRKAAKCWLHLVPMTNNGLLYSRTIRDGGLGIIRLEKLIPTIRMKCIWEMCYSTDDWTRAVAREMVTQPEWDRLWKATGGNTGMAPKLNLAPDTEDDPGTIQAIGLPDWRDQENLIWEKHGSHNKGVSMFRNDKISNTWLRDPSKVSFKPKHYILGLALRSGLPPISDDRHSVSTHANSECRRCGAKNESLSHILGQCTYVKRNIIRRHNKLCDDLQTEMERYKWEVLREVQITNENGVTQIPDVVALKNSTVLIIDVTVRYETADYPLTLAAEEKVSKYSGIGPIVMHMLCAKNYKVFGFPMGARGKWPTCNNPVLKAIGLPMNRRISFAKFLSRRVLLYSIDVVNGFCKI
uniref:Reverse transcriptase domain-containing protein n=1 Tax=Hippocampus comes TaxID=109280 RepID=A0A3Q2YQL5_HIPCM